jgi:hypothetical protein
MAGGLVQVALFLRLRSGTPLDAVMTACLALPAVPAIVLLTPAIMTAFAAVGGVITPVCAALAGLTAALCVPTWQVTVAQKRWWTEAAATGEVSSASALSPALVEAASQLRPGSSVVAGRDRHQ